MRQAYLPRLSCRFKLKKSSNDLEQWRILLYNVIVLRNSDVHRQAARQKGLFMFDILTDIWAHPGAVHSPILPFDITQLDAQNADAEVSRLHKCGFDSLMLRCDENAAVTHELLCSVFDAAAKRHMLIFVDESVLCGATSCTDSALKAFNPMLSARRLALVKDSDAADGELESVLDIFVKMENGKLADAREDLEDVESTDGYERYRFVTQPADGLELLCPECAELLLYGAYQSFIDEYKEASHGTLAGLYTSRLLQYTDDRIYWSYDMLSDMKALGCDAKMLAALFICGDRRSEKEGRRLYIKALNARLDRFFCTPASQLCGEASLAFMGDVPQLFAAGCGRRFTLPTWTREGYSEICDERESVISAVRFLGDTARGEGFTGCAYRAYSENAKELSRELNSVFTAIPAIIIFPECFARDGYLEKISLTREDLKRLCLHIKRRSTLGTSCGGRSSVAVLCDDDLIPYSGAEKLRSMGVDFNFISKAQLIDKAHIHHGEILVDKFRYKTLLWDQRVRTDPAELIKIGEFASYGGQLYRGGAFGDFAKKNIDIDSFLRECAQAGLSVCRIDKCSCTFTALANTSGETVTVSTPRTSDGCYVFDIESGKRLPCPPDEPMRILPGGALILGYDPSTRESETKAARAPLCEVYSLREGENAVKLTLDSTEYAELELDCITGFYVEITVNGHAAHRIVAEPYHIDITNELCDGENTVSLATDGGFLGASLRLYGVK